MPRCVKTFGVVLAALVLSAGAAHGQDTTVRAVPFDSAGQVLQLTGEQARQLGLKPPVWPVSGEFVTARLLAVAAGMFVVEVRRAEGSVERTVLSPDERQALVRDVTRRLAALRAVDPASLPIAPPATAPDSARRDVAGREAVRDTATPGVTRPVAAVPRAMTASSQFIVPQVLLAGLAVGPSVAIIADDRNISPALYLGVLAGTFVAARSATENGEVDVVAAGAANVGGAVGGLLGAVAGVASPAAREAKGVATGAAVGTVAGAIAGYYFGKTASPPDVRAIAAGPLAGAALGYAVAGALTRGPGRHVTIQPRQAVWVAAGGLLATPLSVAWSRHYTGRLTDSDVDAAVPFGVAGALTGAWLASLGEPELSDRRVAIGGGLGYIAGHVLALQGVALTYDLTQSQSRAYAAAVGVGAWIGTIAYAGRSPTATLGGATIGAAATLLAVHSMLELKPDGTQRPRLAARTGQPRSDLWSRVAFDPAGALFAAMRAPGMFPLVRATF